MPGKNPNLYPISRFYNNHLKFSTSKKKLISTNWYKEIRLKVRTLYNGLGTILMKNTKARNRSKWIKVICFVFTLDYVPEPKLTNYLKNLEPINFPVINNLEEMTDKTF